MLVWSSSSTKSLMLGRTAVRVAFYSGREWSRLDGSIARALKQKDAKGGREVRLGLLFVIIMQQYLGHLDHILHDVYANHL